MRSEISERAIGRWHGILSALGIRAEFLRSKHGPCPLCHGRDRYRWDNKEGKGTFYCNGCGAGDGFTLLMNVHGWDFKQTVREIETVIGSAKVLPSRPVKSDDECRRLMYDRWLNCDRIIIGDPVAIYLKSRGIDLLDETTQYPKALKIDQRRVSMVAAMQNPAGKLTMVHDTLLTKEGHKADVSQQRLMMEGRIAKGSAVRLAEFTDVLGIAEGIETALSASKLFGVPCWAALNEGLMQQWQFPREAKRIIIFGDNDQNHVGQSAAFMLARKISLSPDPPIVEVKIPENVGDDWNDILVRKLGCDK